MRFTDGLAELFRDLARAFLEVGPGQALTSLTLQHPGKPKSSKVQSSMRHPQEQISDAAFLLNATGQLWVAGLPVDWNALHTGEEPRRISLPTYPFERQRYWIEPGGKSLARKDDEAAPITEAPQSEQWFHRRVWKKSPAAQKVPAGHACWLLFLDETGLGQEIANQLQTAGHEVVVVVAGEKYKRISNGSYEIRPGVREDYDELLTDIVKYETPPTRILHLWPVTTSSSGRSLDQTLDLSFYSLLFLAQAWADQDLGAVEIVCVSNGLQSVSGEHVVEPARATLLGPIRVIPKELPGTFCRSIDLDRNIQDWGTAASDIIAECSLRSADACVAYRQSERWVENFESISLSQRPAGARLKEKGVYLIVGGLGGIGLAVAEHLARTLHARLVLVGRTQLPPRSEWQTVTAEPQGSNGTQQKIAKLREIESLGAEVLNISADVTDGKQMEAALRIARERFGEIHGVIHAAGSIEDAPLQIKSRESAARVLAAKIQGTLALQQALARNKDKLDFLLLFSSISSLLPPAGQVDYAAANSFLDAFALSQTDLPVTAINWGLWAEVGMAIRAEGHHPILGRRLVQTPNEIVYSGQFSCQKDWFLREHQLKNGAALVPGTAYLQLATSALTSDRFELGVQFDDVFFMAPLSVARDETKEIRVRLRRDDGSFRFSILTKHKEWIEHASGQIARNTKLPPADQDLAAIRSRCSLARIAFDDGHRTQQEQFFDFGPRWRNLHTLRIGEREAVAELRLGEGCSADLEAWMVHPALLDLATGSALYLVDGYRESNALYLPFSYKRITLYRPLPLEFWSHIRCHQRNTTNEEVVTFDVTLLDGHGRVLADIEEFALRRMAGNTGSAGATLSSQPAKAYSEPTESTGAQGISTVDGMKALDQILSCEATTGIIVNRGDFAKPNKLPSAAIPPKSTVKIKSEVESVLSEWWSELLGVEQIGLDDDFFDLGGHSLIAVRLFSKIKKNFRLDLGLSTLFEMRTIRQLAALIRKTEIQSNEETKASAAISSPARHQISRSLAHGGIEGVLSEWCRELLGVEQVGLDDDFFDLGGRSLMAVHLFSKINKTFHLDLGLSALFETRTVRRLADLIRKTETSGIPGRVPPSATHAGHPQEPRLPLFVVFAPGGDITAFDEVRHYLGEDQPVVVLEPQRVDTREPAFTGVEDMAAYYLRRVRDEQPHGPYCLAGHSFGGFVAFEMAQQLHAAEETVSLLGLLDTTGFFSGDGRKPAAKRKVSFLIREMRELMHRLRFSEASGVRDSNIANRLVASTYRPTVYPGRLTIFRSANRNLLETADELLGWKRLAGGGIEVQDVTGDHLDMLSEPNARMLAEKLRICLDRPQGVAVYD